MITVINATDKINGRNIPYIISAFLIDVGLLIDQIKVDDKSNEITAIPELFELIDIKGATITIDSIGTQEEIVNSVVEKGGYYILKAKGNQKMYYKEIKNFYKQHDLYGNSEIR